MRRILTVVLAGCAFSLGAHQAQAQTAQRISIQGSGLFTGLFGNAFKEIKDGVGAELQLRFTPGAWSIGGGLQYTQHNMKSPDVAAVFTKVKLLGFFVEPRYVIDAGSERFAPYLSARLAYSRMTLTIASEFRDILQIGKPSGPTVNGGGGVLVRLSSRANLDIGATYGYTRFNTIGFTIQGEAPQNLALGSGTNLVGRIGLAVGIGG
jgi:hypothetical protein